MSDAEGDKEPILGIDLGTTKSACAIWQDGKPVIIPNAEGHTTTPSVVALDPVSQQWVVGQLAKEIAGDHPAAAVYSIKRFMGRRFGDKQVQDSLNSHRIVYNVREAKGRSGGIEVEVNNTLLSPQEVSAMILRKLKTDASIYLGHEIRRAVITVPAYFNDAQRQATRQAGYIADLDVRRVLNEPTAACLAYGYESLMQARKTVAVYDLGGGTFDISILKVGRGPISVLAVNGNNLLGGDDIDADIVDWILGHMDEAAHALTRQDIVAMARLRVAAELAKKTISQTGQTVHIRIAGPLGPQSPEKDLDVVLESGQLDMLAANTIEKTLTPCSQAIQDAQIPIDEIEEVLLVGGQTRMSAVRRKAAEYFKRQPNTSLHPEEVVALGAAVQGGILNRQVSQVQLNDVVPLSLGVEDNSGLLDVLIHRGDRVPTPIVERSYTTVIDKQYGAKVNIYQGERPFVADEGNTKLDSLTLYGVTLAERGVPNITVAFSIDEDGFLHVSVKDAGTGSEVSKVVRDSLGLSGEEIEARRHLAEERALEDARRVEQFTLTQQAEDLKSRLRALLEQKRGSLPVDLVGEVQQLLEASIPVDMEDWVNRLREVFQRANKVR